MSYAIVKKVIFQYIELLNGLKTYGHINVTGGEPFIHSEFFKILQLFFDNEKFFSYGILSNGSLINDNTSEKLKKLSPSFIQLSIEGTKNTHNEIRGKGNLEKVKQAINSLAKNNIKTIISFTAHKDNYMEFNKVANFCRVNNVFKLWTDRLVPFDGAKKLTDKVLTKKETLEYLNIIFKSQSQKFLFKRPKTIIESKRALQFMADKSIAYRCRAGEGILTVMEDGTIYPCRRLPIKVGNIHESNLYDIYKTSKLINELRDSTPPDECKSCIKIYECHGGAKCISYAVTGNMYARDPGCPIEF